MLQKLTRRGFSEAAGPQLMARAPDRRTRVMLIAPLDALPPFPYGHDLLHRLRVVVMRHNAVLDVPHSQVIGDLPQLETTAMTSPPSRPLQQPRRLQGEILCDEAGRLYEKIGHFVQPIHQLVAGPRGEVLDLAPPRPLRPRSRDDEEPVDTSEPSTIDASAWNQGRAPVERPTAETADARPQAASWRELPDVRSRIVRFGEFRNAVAPQLQHPGRLRDSHLLSVRVHLCESARAQRVETLVPSTANGAVAQPLPLTPALAARLDVADLVPRRSPSATRKLPGIVQPGERVLWLEVLNDPTATAPLATADSDRAGPGAAPTATPPAASSERASHAQRKSIPERFLVPWQFAIGREEAIYDLNVEATRPRLRSLFARLWVAAKNRRELHKWQALLNGRSLDEQLWDVRPPGDTLSNPMIREWARRMLEAAGYDASTMLFEWDVYWRRKRR